MTFMEFVQRALTVDENAIIGEDPDGYLYISTAYRVVGDDTVPLAYDPDGLEVL